MTKQLPNRKFKLTKGKGGLVTASGLTSKEEQFCQLYACMGDMEYFGNGTKCCIFAYGDGKLTEKTAGVMAVKMLKKPKIIERVNRLLEAEGFTEENVDRQHLFLINQFVDLKVKLGAIREFNSVKGRITKRLDVTTDGEKLNNFTEEQIQNIARRVLNKPSK